MVEEMVQGAKGALTIPEWIPEQVVAPAGEPALQTQQGNLGMSENTRPNLHAPAAAASYAQSSCQGHT